MSWLIKFAVTAAVGILAVKLIGGTGAQSIVTTTDGMNLLKTTKYLDETSHDVVLVGSSLSARLSEGYFTSLKIDNLALAGGASVTGLEIIAAAAARPKLVLVEANILSRPLDTDLIAKSTVRDPVFQPVRWAVGTYERFLHPPKTKEEGHQEADRLLSRPPENVVDGRAVERAIGEASTPAPSGVIEKSLFEIRRLKFALEAKGVSVLLLQVPCSDAIETAPFASTTTRLAAAAFPDQSSWLQIDVDRSQLRWTDGVHLDERSAILVSRAIEAATGKLNAR